MRIQSLVESHLVAALVATVAAVFSSRSPAQGLPENRQAAEKKTDSAEAAGPEASWSDALKQDLAALQGTWVAEHRGESGQVVKRMTKRVAGTTEEVTRVGRNGRLLSKGEVDAGAEARRQKVLALLKRRGPLEAIEIAEELKASPRLVKRDLSEMFEQGFLEKIHPNPDTVLFGVAK